LPLPQSVVNPPLVESRETFWLFAVSESPFGRASAQCRSVYYRPMPGDPIFDVTTSLGECPVWDHRIEQLWWVDIDGTTVWRGDPASGKVVAFPSEGRPAALALTANPAVVLVAREGELAWLDDGSFLPWITLEDLPGNRLNDGRVAPDGSFWVGSMHADTSLRMSTGVLYRVLPSGWSTVARTHIGVTNGLAFSPRGDRLFFADTFTDEVEAYDYPTSSVVDGEVFARLDSLNGRPDGGCVDSEGNYWLAAVHGSQLLCFSPQGDLKRTIEVPVVRPTRVTFGGPKLEQMFVTSIGPRPGDREDGQGLDGRVLVLDVGVAGLPEELFGGQGTPE